MYNFISIYSSLDLNFQFDETGEAGFLRASNINMGYITYIYLLFY